MLEQPDIFVPGRAFVNECVPPNDHENNDVANEENNTEILVRTPSREDIRWHEWQSGEAGAGMMAYIGTFPESLPDDTAPVPNIHLSRGDIEYIDTLLQVSAMQQKFCHCSAAGIVSGECAACCTGSSEDSSSRGTPDPVWRDPDSPEYHHVPQEPATDGRESPELIGLDPFGDIPSFVSSPSIMQPTLMAKKLFPFPGTEIPRNYLQHELAYPAVLFRNAISFLCGKKKITVNFCLDHAVTLPIELERGLNIFCFAPANLHVNPDSFATTSLLKKSREGTGLTFSFEEDVRLCTLYSGVVNHVVSHNYMIGSRPEEVLVVTQNDVYETDWRFWRLLAILKGREWPSTVKMCIHDIFVKIRETHMLDYKHNVYMPVMTRQYS